MLHEAMRRNEVIKTQYVPFQPVTCLDSMLGMITNGLLSGPYLYICGRACATVSRCTSNIFGCRGNSVGEAGLQSITCTQTRRCAVWCCRSGSVWGSCTCPVRLSCSRRGWRRWPSSCSRRERWPTLSSEPGNTQRGKHLRGLQTNLPSFLPASQHFVWGRRSTMQPHIYCDCSKTVARSWPVFCWFFPKAHLWTFQRGVWRKYPFEYTPKGYIPHAESIKRASLCKFFFR